MSLIIDVQEFIINFAEKDLKTLVLVLATYFIVPYLVSLLFGKRMRKRTITKMVDSLTVIEGKEREELIDRLTELYSQGKDEEVANELVKLLPLNSQKGFVSREILLTLVPAIIALSFTFVVIYLHVVNQAVPDYKTPDIFSTGLTTIIGYYFGVNVGATTSDSESELKAKLKAKGVNV